MWPFRRRVKRSVKPACNGSSARESLHQAQAGLRDALERSVEVDRLAREVRRALGSNR